MQKTATIASIGEKPLELCNDSGTVLYQLLFAAKNATALEIATHLLKPARAPRPS